MVRGVLREIGTQDASCTADLGHQFYVSQNLVITKSDLYNDMTTSIEVVFFVCIYPEFAHHT
jgi:hypothetical protein